MADSSIGLDETEMPDRPAPGAKPPGPQGPDRPGNTAPRSRQPAPAAARDTTGGASQNVADNGATPAEEAHDRLVDNDRRNA